MKTLTFDLTPSNLWKLIKKLVKYYILFTVIMAVTPSVMSAISVLWLPLSILFVIRLWSKSETKKFTITLRNPFKR